MSDMTGIPAFGGGGFAFRQPPDQPKQAVPEVASNANDGSATSNKGQDLPGQNGQKFQLGFRSTKGEGPAPASAFAQRAQQSDVASDRAADRRADDAAVDQDAIARAALREDGSVEKSGKDILVGPTPAFQASLLEVESDLRNVIAQVEAKRTQEADVAAVSPSKDTASSEQPSPRDRQDRAVQSDPRHNAQERRVERDQSAEKQAENAAASERLTQQIQQETQHNQAVQDRETAYSGAASAAVQPYDG